VKGFRLADHFKVVLVSKPELDHQVAVIRPGDHTWGEAQWAAYHAHRIKTAFDLASLFQGFFAGGELFAASRLHGDTHALVAGKASGICRKVFVAENPQAS
jgi:hypothetical protein